MDKSLLRVVSAAVAMWLTPAAAQSLRLDIVEFRNTLTGHFFMTGDPGEIAAFDSGQAGMGWARTGAVLEALRYESSCVATKVCAAVHRFYRPHNNTHFYTANEVEIARSSVPGSGLRHEGIAFMTNTCPAGNSRYYNNRPDDPNHRYAGRQEAMLAKGWVEEKSALCTFNRSLPFKQVTLDYGRSPLQSAPTSLEECRKRDGACLAVSNVTPEEVEVTGERGVRLKISTNGRAPQQLASAGPFYGLGAESFRLFHGYPLDTELTFQHSGALLAAKATDTSSQVYGHPVLELNDSRSGLPLHFSVLTFGDDLATDYLGRDALSGTVIVGTTHRRDSPFLVIGANESFQPSILQAHPNGWPVGLSFRMTRNEFRRVIDRARQIEPALSADPSDYVLTALRYKNEIAGNGVIEMSFGFVFSVSLSESTR